METDERHAGVHHTNLEQARAWGSTEGEYWAVHADRFDRCYAGYGDRFRQAAAVRRRDRVLDVGCGAGGTTCDAARAAADGRVLGVDLSAHLLQVARDRARSAGLRNVSFVNGDAQVHPFEPEEYDVVLSRTGAMFFGDPVAAFANLRGATRAGGRLVLMTWRSPGENAWIGGTLGALSGTSGPPPGPPDPTQPGPFSLSDPDRIHAVLEAAGWTGVRLEGVAAPLWFGADVADALGFLQGLFAWRLEALAPDERQEAVARLRRSLARNAGPAGVELGSAAWLVTAQREVRP